MKEGRKEEIYEKRGNKQEVGLYRMAQKEGMFLNLPVISFFGVTSNQKSTFENLVQSTI